MNRDHDSRVSRQEDVIHLRDIWNLLLRNWFLISFSLFVVVGATAAYTFTAVPVYQSTSTIRIDEENSSVPVLDILQSLSVGSQVETEMEVLRSRTLAEAVVLEMQLQLGVAQPRGVARAHLLTAVHVEPWAPEATYRLEGRAGRGYDIYQGENGSVVGTVSVTQPAVLPGVTFTLQPAALDHESRNDPVKDQSIVETRFNVFEEVRDRNRSRLRQQLDPQNSLRRLHYDHGDLRFLARLATRGGRRERKNA